MLGFQAEEGGTANRLQLLTKSSPRCFMLREGGGLGASFTGLGRPVSSGLFLLELLTILLPRLGCPAALQAAFMTQVKVELFLTSVLSLTSAPLTTSRCFCLGWEQQCPAQQKTPAN